MFYPRANTARGNVCFAPLSAAVENGKACYITRMPVNMTSMPGLMHAVHASEPGDPVDGFGAPDNRVPVSDIDYGMISWSRENHAVAVFVDGAYPARQQLMVVKVDGTLGAATSIAESVAELIEETTGPGLTWAVPRQPYPTVTPLAPSQPSSDMPPDPTHDATETPPTE